MFYGATMLALIILRYKEPYASQPRPYKVHLSIPLLVFLISIYLVVAPIVENPQIEYLYATLYILSGLLVYLIFVKWQYKCTTIVGTYSPLSTQPQTDLNLLFNFPFVCQTLSPR